MPREITLEEAYGGTPGPAPAPPPQKPAGRSISLEDAYALGPEPIGLGRAGVQGLARGVSDLGAAVAGSAIGWPSRLVAGGPLTDPRERRIALMDGGAMARRVFESLITPYLAKPGTENERTFETVARSATVGVPMSIATGGGAQILGAVTGPLAAEVARRTGHSHPVNIGGAEIPVGEIVANIAGGAAPQSIGTAITAAPGKVGAVASRVERGLNPAARQEAALFGAGGTLRAAGIDPDDARTMARLGDEAIGAAGPGRASTAQALMDDAPNTLVLEGSVAKHSGTLGTRLQRLREQSGAELRNAGDMAFSGTPAAAKTGLVALRDAAKAEASALYDAIDDAAVGSVSLSRVKDAAESIVADAGSFGRRTVPSVVRDVLKEPGNVTTFGKLRELRVAVNDRLKTVSTAVARGAGGSAQEQRHLQRLKASVDETFNALEGAGGTAAEQLRAANAAYARYSETYSRAHPTIRKLIDNEEPGDAIRALTGKGTARPSDEARRLVRALEGDPDAMEGLRRVFVEEAFGGQVGDGPAAKAIKFFADHEKPARIILGDDGYETARLLADRLRKTTYGRVGTPGFSQSTGSIFGPASESLEQGVGVVEAILSPTGAATNAAARAAAEWMRDKATQRVQLQLLEDALVDTKVAKDILEKTRPENIVSWQRRMEKHLRRSAARSAATTAVQE